MLPLLQDPAVIELQPLLQRALLLQGPERVFSSLVQRPPLAPRVLVAFLSPDRPLGLAVLRRLNRSGSCWGVEQLRLCRGAMGEHGAPSSRQVEGALLRHALGGSHGATSWIATAPAGDGDRLALLREQGFQPLRHQTLWYWEPAGGPSPAAAPPGDLLQRPLNRRTAALLWHLEQATSPAQLRQLLDRRIEDVLDQSEGPGLLWVDPSRQQAVAAVRRLRREGPGLGELDVVVHPAWSHLLGGALAALVRTRAQPEPAVRLRSDASDTGRARWLMELGAVAEGEELLMARSVWRRQGPQLSPAARWRLDTVLGSLQPRRRPLPTPLQGARTPATLGPGR